MDQTQLKQKIAEYYAKLPPTAQKVFSEMSWLETLRGISTEYNLNQEQIETLAIETTLAFLGIVHIEEYEQTLIKKLKLSKELTDKLILEINEKIFKNLRASLEEAFVKNAEELEAEDQNSDENKEDDTISEKTISVASAAQDMLSNLEYQKKLTGIGTKYKLNSLQMSSLQDVTRRFIAGEISGSQYENSLEISTDLPAHIVHDIALDVNTTVLSSIRSQISQTTQAPIQTTKEEPQVAVEEEDLELPLPPYAKQKATAVVQAPVEAPIAFSRATDPVPVPPPSGSRYTPARVINESVISTVPEPLPKEGPVSGKDKGVLATAGIEIMDIQRASGKKDPYHEVIE